MLLTAEGITKHFGGVRALRGADLTVRGGEVHLLLGENGAGKSTLMKILSGMYRPDAGTLSWDGSPLLLENPAAAARQGIAMVHQESSLAPHLTVAENIFLGRESASPFGWVNRRAIVEKARRVIADNGFQLLRAETRAGDLTPAGKQLVEVCRAMAQGSTLLIFDEPTSSLSEAETREVFRVVRQLRDRGVAIIYITHRMDELRAIGDRVTVLRDGGTVYTGMLRDITRPHLIQHMVGRPIADLYRRDPVPPGGTLLSVHDVCHRRLQNISFTINAGEIVGLAGLMGAGRTELCRILFGIDRSESGTVEVAGKPVYAINPREAIRSGVALIPEDRQHHGLVLKLPIAYNITLPDLEHVSSMGFLRKGAEAAIAGQYRERLAIRCRSVKQRAGSLSGGNQQKIVIAKWVARGARVFLFDEPTRGIDIAAKQEVFEQMDRLAKEGAAVLMVSSELPELIQVADRILVMSEGRLTGELPRGCSQEEIMHLAAPRVKETVAAH